MRHAPVRLLVVALLLGPSGAAAASLEVALAFQGVGGGFPPDTMGAVGPEHVVEITNGGYAVHRKSDGATLSALSLAGFWLAAGVPTSDTFDPRILYDPGSGRFFAVGLNGRTSSNELLLAVSKGADPALGWSGFALDSDATDATWADFPTIGVDADDVVVAADMLPAGGNGSELPVAVDVLVVPKADLLADPPTVAGATLFERAPLATTGFAPQPVTRLDGGGLPTWMLSSALAFLGTLQTTRIAGTPTAPTLAPGPLTMVDPHPTPPEAIQPGSALLDTGDGHVASPVARDGSIWAVHSAQGPSGRAAIHWLELDADTAALRQQGLIEDPTRDFLYPSIAVNELGHVVIGFSASSAGLPPSAFAVLGETLAGTTSFGTPLPVLSGSGPLSGGGVLRFGDYSATVADPSDPLRFWTFQEIGGAGALGAVAIAALDVPEPGPRATAAAAALALALLVGRSRPAR